MTIATTIKQVNKAIAKAGIVGEVVKGRGYFWFTGDDIECGCTGVYVNKLGDLSLEDWVEEAKERRK